jgi:predicted Zn-dependent peptidase
LILSEKVFERFKKAVLGSFIKSLNNLDFLTSLIIEYDLKNCDILESISLLEKLQITDLDSVLKYFRKEAISSYLILPSEKKWLKIDKRM